MKTHPLTRRELIRMFFCLVVTGACFFADPALAGGTKAGAIAAKAGETKTAKTAKVMVTGSNVPQAATQMSCIPTTASPMIILGRTEINRSGQSTVADVLRRLPIAR